MLPYIIAAIFGIPFAAVLTIWLVGERGHILGLPSTRAAIRGEIPGGPKGIHFKTIHGYLYGRFPNVYIPIAIKYLLPRWSDSFKKTWANHYHGKVLPLELARSIITLDHDIPRMDLEQIIPYPTARNIVLTASPDVALLDCPCRNMRENPCEPVRVCMIVGNGVEFVLDHMPEQAQRVTQAEALEVLREEHERGHVHVAYFKDACNDQFYAICNCCSCCCGGIEAMRSHSPMVTSSGYVAKFDHNECSACGNCEDVCPFDAITVNGYAAVKYEACMGCGVCVSQCPNEAIELVRDEAKGIPLDVRTLP